MGAHLVTLVLTHWTHLNDRAFRLLVRMAHTALDKPNGEIPAGVYFGGRDLLAMTLRTERGGNADSLHRSVKRGIADLVGEGVIERTQHARSGSNQVYRLRLSEAQRIDVPNGHKPPTAPDQGDTRRPPEGDTRGTAQGDTSGSKRGTPGVPPICTEEELEELREERSEDLRTDVAVARACEVREESISPPVDVPQKCEDPRCAKGWIVVNGEFADCPKCASTPATESSRPSLRLVQGGAA